LGIDAEGGGSWPPGHRREGVQRAGAIEMSTRLSLIRIGVIWDGPLPVLFGWIDKPIVDQDFPSTRWMPVAGTCRASS